MAPSISSAERYVFFTAPATARRITVAGEGEDVDRPCVDEA